MSTQKTYPILPTASASTHINASQHATFYQQSLDNPESFWGEQANKFITWSQPFKKVMEGGFEQLDMRWFIEGKLNACYNCLDRHLASKANQIAIIWEGDEPGEQKTFTYKELHQAVSKFANVLKAQGIKKGDRVSIYLPMIPEVAIAMLACARIGAVHSVVFAGFSPASLQMRILDAESSIVITADEGLRGGKKIPLKNNVDEAVAHCPSIEHVIVVKRTGGKIKWQQARDLWYHEAMENVSDDCPCEEMDADDPLFILYTSGSTGKPKGVLHGTGGYLVYVAMTHCYVFDYHDNDIYWCTADTGWITGHSYIIYGPLANGATTLMFEGVPNYPDHSRFWEIIDKYQVNIFYTAPTAIRALRCEGDQWVKKTSRKSLKLLGSVGEPINPEVWEWYYDIVGEKKCPIVDTWWQTETGGIMITALPGATEPKPGAASWPFLGVELGIVDDAGNEITDHSTGQLVIKRPWPGMMQTIYGDHQRFIDAYFKASPGNYLTGDNAHCDEDGYYWIAGRSDDVINVSGHRIGTEEVESALVSHDHVSEAAVVGIADEIKGQSIYAFVTLKAGMDGTNELKAELIKHVRSVIGPIAAPKIIQWAPSLPKTRSGKIMRRILRKIASGDAESIGDTSTLADPKVVEALVASQMS